LHLFLSSEEGQDLVEYALVVALIAFAATASMKALASGIKTAFSNTSAALSSNIT
jgi:pilus assembly protein Flp/PilA